MTEFLMRRRSPQADGRTRYLSPNSDFTLLGRSENRSSGAPAACGSGAAVGASDWPLSAAATRGLLVHRSRTKRETGWPWLSLNRLWKVGRVSTGAGAAAVTATGCAAGTLVTGAAATALIGCGAGATVLAGNAGVARATS